MYTLEIHDNGQRVHRSTAPNHAAILDTLAELDYRASELELFQSSKYDGETRRRYRVLDSGHIVTVTRSPHFDTLAEIEDANRAAGEYFFSPKSFRFWNTRVLPEVYHGRYFVTQDQIADDCPLLFTVHYVNGNGEINAVSRASRDLDGAISAIDADAARFYATGLPLRHPDA